MRNSRKAVLVGINNYGSLSASLRGCIKDARDLGAVINCNENGTRNFDVQVYEDVPTKADLTELIQTVFKGEHDVSLFYFSGHGMVDELDTYLVTPDARPFDPGVSVNSLLRLANASKSRNRIIILDCCHAGAAGGSNLLGGTIAYIESGVTILAASKADEPSVEVDGHGVFTNLLIQALKGGAADANGNISPGGVYAYIDEALGAFDQRPVFKTNVTTFISLRTMHPKIQLDTLKKITDYFPDPQFDFPLNPSFEDTNSHAVEHLVIEPYADSKNIAVFKDMQDYFKAGLLEPVGTRFMYFAAMESRSCKLTPLGYHYWRLVHQGRI